MNYSFKTISKKVMGDLHTPVSIYLKVRDIYPESALLESSDFHGNENSLSFIALRPLASIGINNGECTATFPDETREVTPLTEDYNVPEAMNAFLGRFKVEGADKKVCGLFGYTAFDAVRYFENIPVMEVHHEENDAPDMLYILYKYILVFNHFKNELTLVEMLQEDEASRLEEIETLIENRNFASYNFQTAGPETSPITGEEYKAMVRQGIKHCLRGDVFQIVLSRRFEQPFKGDDFKVYRALRSINPSPYLFYFDFGGFRIFGSSPETHCKVTGGHASIDPIAGTAFRTGNIEVDKQRTEALLADPKENAEHVMLVDLARNDLSRNAHDVQVDFYKEVQYYSHVIHLVSRVSGEINTDSDPVKTYVDTSYNFQTAGPETSPITGEEYKAMVRQGIKHCLRGDVFQIVLSRRFEQPFKGDDFKVYRALRSINPSPYLFYFDFGGFRIFGSSPETHCKVTGGHASIDPIAGTAFRTGNIEVDKQRTEALLADPKENAEHVMLVDLARNDLSRNAHDVQVDFYKEVQYYSHVIHLVSRVSGEINTDSDPVKTYVDTFPAGTLSGAPKVRAMQLITDIEHHNRGAYGGCIGFIGLDGDLNQAITIRTFVSRGNVLYYQAGAGIVAKSNDERELQEVNNKLGALKKAIDLAEKLIN